MLNAEKRVSDPSVEIDNPEIYQFYYHPDHLGSTSIITNLDGDMVQHLEYILFGEVFLEERNSQWNSPYLFNGKELDEQTGLYYYGARYYNPRESMWLGVDPLADKYPGVTPYAYTLNNPVRYIDPFGLDIDPASQKEWDANKSAVQQRLNDISAQIVAGGNKRTLRQLNERASSLSNTLGIISEAETSSQTYSLTGIGEDGLGGLTLGADNVINISYAGTANFVHEIEHVGQFERQELGFLTDSGLTVANDVYKEVAAYKAQYAYDPQSVKGIQSSYSPSNMGQITPQWVQNIIHNGNYIYQPGKFANTGLYPVNLNSTGVQIRQSYNLKSTDLPDNFNYKLLPNLYYKR